MLKNLSSANKPKLHISIGMPYFPPKITTAGKKRRLFYLFFGIHYKGHIPSGAR